MKTNLLRPFYPFFFLLLVCSLSLLTIQVRAQKEANNWYFGRNAGLSFNRNPPQVLTNGQAWGQWGHSSISDANGNLLFYSSGFAGNMQAALLDRRHLGMPNGSGFGLVQSNSIFVPYPGQPQKHFYFYRYEGTGNPTQPGPLYQAFSVIDLTLNNGFGDVTNTKNVFIHAPDAFEVIGVQHWNNRDFWVIYYTENTNIFKSFLISPAGVNLTPIVSTPNFTPAITSGYNSIKISPDGKTIAIINTYSDIKLFNFDATTGLVTYKDSLPDTTAQGIEFSPDGSILYATRAVPASTNLHTFQLVQYDLGAGTASAIFNSAAVVFQSQSMHFGGNILSLQVGPDGKIYSTIGFTQNSLNQPVYGSGTRYLSVINRPNLKGTACRFIPNMIDLDINNTGVVDAGDILPTFIQSYFYRPKITMQQTCFGDTAFFALGNPAYVDSVEWNFGDPASGIHNTSTLFNPKHFYATPGPKQVQAIVHFNFYSDTLSQTIYIPTSIVKPNLGRDTTLCVGDTLILNAYQPGASYEWQDSINTDSVYVVTKPGTYWVQVSNGCGTLSDSIVVNFDRPLSLALPSDTTLCPGQTLTLSVNASGGNLLWSDSTSATTLVVSKPGTYWAELSNACGSWRDSITVNYRPIVINNWLPKDTILCSTEPFEIKGEHPQALSYKWQDGSTFSSFTASVSGTYWLEVTTACATVRDSIQVTINKLPETRFADTTICNGDSFVLTAPKALSYRWNTGDTTQSISISKAGNYQVELETVQGCFFSDSLEVKQERCFKTAFIPNIVTPNNDNLNDRFEPKGLAAGQYELSIYNRWGSLIYQHDNYKDQWPDKKLSDGTYYYLLRNKQTGKTYKGWVEVKQ